MYSEPFLRRQHVYSLFEKLLKINDNATRLLLISSRHILTSIISYIRLNPKMMPFVTRATLRHSAVKADLMSCSGCRHRDGFWPPSLHPNCLVRISILILNCFLSKELSASCLIGKRTSSCLKSIFNQPPQCDKFYRSSQAFTTRSASSLQLFCQPES